MTKSEPEKKLTTIRRSDELSDYYAECSNSMRNNCNETVRHLNELLVTASLAFLGVITAVIGNSELSNGLVCYQRWLVVSGSASFVLATIFGVIEAVSDIRFFKRVSPLFGELSNILGRGSLDKTSVDRLGEVEDELNRKKNLKAGGGVLIVQIVFFLLGIGLISVFVCSLLFD